MKVAHIAVIACGYHRPSVARARIASGGQAAVEYLIATAALAFVLFVGQPSLVEQFLTAVQTAYWRVFLALSMP